MLIKNVRMSFPSIYKPTAFKKGQTEKYSVTLIVPPGDAQMDLINQEMTRVALAKWGDANGNLPPGLLENLMQKPCVRKNETKRAKDGGSMDGFEPGGHFFNASNSLPPTTIDQYGNPAAEGSGVIYAGCYVNAVIEFWAQDNEFGKRINASLGGVQFAGDGAAFGGGRPASVDQFDLADPSNALEQATAAATPVAAQPAAQPAAAEAAQVTPPPPINGAKRSVNESLFV